MSTSLDAEEKLVWLGIQTNSAKVNALQGDVNNLKDTVGDFEDFKTEVDNATSYSDLRDTLVNDYGWSAENADAFISRLQNEFDSFSDFQDQVVNNYSSYSELQQVFDQATTFQGDQQTASGQPAAGIRVHESDGVSYSGVSVPAGTTEVFGDRVEFSQQDPPRGTEEPVTYANMSSDDADNVVNTFQSITFSADASNPNGFQVDTQVSLTEDGSVIQSKQISLAANETKTVSFTVTKEDYICADYAIGGLDPILACWAPAGLTV
jgi:hypothetical protein